MNLTISELEERFGYSRQTWRKWWRAGKFPHAVQGPPIQIPLIDVRLHLRNRRLRQEPEPHEQEESPIYVQFARLRSEGGDV